MTEAAGTAGNRGRRWPLLLGGVLALAGGGASFHAIERGIVPPPSAVFAKVDGYQPPAGWSAPSFVELDPVILSLGPAASARHLRVNLVLEVAPGSEDAVEAALPRLRDALNLYLRAVDERDLAMPALTERLRAGMLRRVQAAAPEGAVHDILIHEFLLD